MGDPLLHIKPMAEGDSLKERFKHHRKAAKSQSNTTHQSINDFIRFTKNENHFVNFTGATFALATHVYTSVHKAWFPYDRPDRPSRLKIGPSDRDDHMETQQRRLRRPGRLGRSRSLGSLLVLSGRSGLS